MNKNQQQQERRRMDSKDFFSQVSRHTHVNTEILISTWMVKLINIEIILGKEKKKWTALSNLHFSWETLKLNISKKKKCIDKNVLL